VGQSEGESWRARDGLHRGFRTGIDTSVSRAGVSVENEIIQAHFQRVGKRRLATLIRATASIDARQCLDDVSGLDASGHVNSCDRVH
jgi:hypothetical protein